MSKSKIARTPRRVEPTAPDSHWQELLAALHEAERYAVCAWDSLRDTPNADMGDRVLQRVHHCRALADGIDAQVKP